MNNDNNAGSDIDEISEKLDELTEIVKDNQRMTISLYRRARLTGFVIVIKYLIIIGITVGAFYYVQPVIDKTMHLYDVVLGKGANGTDQNPMKFDFSRVTDFFKSF